MSGTIASEVSRTVPPGRPVRFAAVVSHPIQHYAPLFRDLAAVPGVDVRVFYCCDWGAASYHDPDFGCDVKWDVPLTEGYAHEFLPIRRKPTALTFRQVDNPEVGARLAAFRPDLVWLHGYAHRTQWRALWWCRTHGVKTLMFGDSELLHRRSWPVRVAKQIVLRNLYSVIDGFFTIGDQNERYYRNYGVPARKMFRGACPVDIGRFRKTIAEDPARRQAVRASFGIPPDAMVALCAGKLIPIKRPQDLIEALALLRDVPASVLRAVFVGTGPLEASLRGRAEALSLADRVVFAGFVNQVDMPHVMHAGDVGVVCSSKDPHPLVVTEGMVAGQAIVASDRVGCVGPSDAARPGVNALVYPCGDAAALAACLRRLLDEPDLRRQMSEASRTLATTQGTEVGVAAIVRAMRAFGLVPGG